MTAVPQHMQALAGANRIRLARAALKRDIFAGRESAAAVILDPPECAEGMAVSEVLGAQFRWGAFRVRNLLHTAQVTERRKLGELTERQRMVLAHLLRHSS